MTGDIELVGDPTSAPETTVTAAPNARLVAERLDFWARQLSQVTSTTCGFVDGNVASPITCGEDFYCLSDTSLNVHYCGIFGNAWPPTACVDSTAMTACDKTCLGDLSTEKCTYGTSSYCVTMYWSGQNPPMSQFSCAPSPATWSVITAKSVLTNGATDGSSTSSSTGDHLTTTTNSFPTGTSHSTATQTIGSSATESPTSSSSSGFPQSDIKWVVIGVIGGLFVILCVVVGVRKWRKSQRTAHAFDGPYLLPPAQQQIPAWSSPSPPPQPTAWTTYPAVPVSHYPGARSEVAPDDSVSQVHVPSMVSHRMQYSQAPSGSTGL